MAKRETVNKSGTVAMITSSCHMSEDQIRIGWNWLSCKQSGLAASRADSLQAEWTPDTAAAAASRGEFDTAAVVSRVESFGSCIPPILVWEKTISRMQGQHTSASWLGQKKNLRHWQLPTTLKTFAITNKLCVVGLQCAKMAGNCKVWRWEKHGGAKATNTTFTS